MMTRRRVWDPDADARNKSGENNALQRKETVKTREISARNVSVTIKTTEPFPKSERRGRTDGADEKDEDAAVRSSTSAAEMKQSRYSDARGCRATWISSSRST